MQVRVIAKAGYEEALLGLSLSHNAQLERMPKVAEKLASTHEKSTVFTDY